MTERARLPARRPRNVPYRGRQGERESPPRGMRREHRCGISRSSQTSYGARTTVPSVHVQHRIEQYPECAERLPAPFGTETEQHHVAGLDQHIERGGLALQILLTDQISRKERRA